MSDITARPHPHPDLAEHVTILEGLGVIQPDARTEQDDARDVIREFVAQIPGVREALRTVKPRPNWGVSNQSNVGQSIAHAFADRDLLAVERSLSAIAPPKESAP